MRAVARDQRLAVVGRYMARRAGQSRGLGWALKLNMALVGCAAMSCFGLASVSAADSVSRSRTSVVVQTRSGWVRGVALGFTRQFLGIPYAAPPTGALRFEPPQPPVRWSGVRAATTEPANCPQAAGVDPGLTTTSLDEDCLGLDVITPEPGPKRPQPVYVFIHGGGFLVGHLGFENMSQFVERTHVIAVTINYRLGPFGFLDLPGMSGGGGNLALLDQQAALRWVRRDIGAFGGDPNNVTLGGQSAGGGSVCAQLASPRARGLFQHAVLESGWDCNATRTPDQARAQSIALAHQLGCTDDAALLACLQTRPTEAIVNAEGAFPNVVGPVLTWGPEVGTSVLPESPESAFVDGSFNRMPVLLGSNSSDIPGLPCLTQGYALALSKWVPTYRYDFADETAPPLPGRPPSAAGHGAQHSAELEYLYLFNGLPAPLNTAQQNLADQMIRYSDEFIRRGDPNAAWLVHWPRIGAAQPNVLTLTATGISVTTNYAQTYGCTSQ
jgi:para-nitrobenzyl esterase